MDDADRAEDLIEHAIEDGIAEARRTPPGPAAIGECLFCGKPLPAPRRWCDAACRDDWQAEQDDRKRGGR